MLLKNLLLVDTKSKKGPAEFKKVDILIERQKIKKISKQIASGNYKVMDCKKALVFEGFFDFSAQLGDPGNLQVEDFTSLSNAALHAGFTSVCVEPNTLPNIDHPQLLEGQIKKAEHLPINLFFKANLSLQAQPEKLAELYRMHAKGAVAFTMKDKGIQQASLLAKALEYTKAFDGLVIQHAFDQSICKTEFVAQGKYATKIGLKGMPAYFETTRVARDLELLKYHSGRLHFSNISRHESVKMIAKAKKQGLKVSCDVSIWHLIYDDQSIEQLNSNLKVFPPFFDATNKKKLIQAVEDRLVDVVTSSHTPIAKQDKMLEIEQAKPGISSLDFFYATYQTFLSDKISWASFLDATSVQPRSILGLIQPKIKEGAQANFVILDQTSSFKATEDMMHSKSKNTPLLAQSLKGKVMAVFQNAKRLV